MAINSLTKPYHRTIMALNALRPMDDRELRADRAYGAFILTTFVLVPVAAYPFSILLGGPSFAIAAAISLVSVGVGLTGGLRTRWRILANFFEVMDVDRRIDLKPVETRRDLDRLMTVPAFAFAGSADAGHRLFVYNWLHNRRVLGPKERLTMYAICEDSQCWYIDNELDTDTNLLLVPEEELILPQDPFLFSRFYFELSRVGGAHLRRQAPAENRTPPSGVAESDEYLANKGGTL